MKNAIDTVLKQFIGSAGRTELSDHSEMSAPGNGVTPLITWDTSRNITQDLARKGYSHIRRFVVLPTKESPRWVLPSGDARQTVEAFQVYRPYSVKARTLKRLLSGAIKIGLTRWSHPHLLVASVKPLPLELLVTELTGERRPSFALTLGTATRYRKLTVQVSRRSGERLVYIKLPLTEKATARVRHEAETLSRLWNFPALRPHIPKLLHAGEWQDNYILIETCGPAGEGPIAFGSAHEEFLRTLWSVHRTEKPGHVLVEEVAARWQEFAPLLDAEWQQLGRRALERANLELDGIQISCGIMHGDFTPPNTRVDKERLFLFDWEHASWQAPLLWDVFHFYIQTGRVFNKMRENGIPLGQPSTKRASFVLYLLNSVCQLLDEESPGMKAAIDYRRRILLNELTELSAM